MDDTSVEVTDFGFVGLRKSRVTSGDKISSCLSSVAVSSQYQIAICCTGPNELSSFSTSAIHDLIPSKDNANLEFTGLEKKNITLPGVQGINSLGINADGKILAVLCSTSNGCFVYLFDIRVFSQKFNQPVSYFLSVRIGSDPSATGVCLEWNPAISETFAASASDKTLLVASVSLDKPKTYQIIGSKQLPEVSLAISWSPKGKQLVIGDQSGAILQLKPELEIVRNTPTKEGLPGVSPGTALTLSGLCWLATTDWLVSFSEKDKSDSYTYILRILKNKPPSWTVLTDLQYGNQSSKLQPKISANCSLLVAWNLILVSNSKTSEVIVIGKKGDDWKVWSLDDCDRFDLPTDAQMGDTFPVGMAIDLSATKPVVIDPSTQKTHRASPIAYVLNSDGVLAANHIIFQQDVADIQIPTLPINLSEVVIGNPLVKVETPAVSKSTSIFGNQSSSLLGSPAPGSVSLFGSTAPSTLFSSKAASTIAPAPVVNATPLSNTAPTSNTIFSPTKATAPNKIIGSSLSSTATTTITQTSKPIAQTHHVPEPTADTQKSVFNSAGKSEVTTKPVPVEEPASDPTVDIQKARASLTTTIGNMNTQWNGLREDIGVLQIGLQKAKPLVDAAVDQDIDGQEVIIDMIKTNSNLEEIMNGLEKQLKEAFATAAEKNDIADMYKGDKSLLKRMKETDDFDREERMKRLITRMDDLKEKYADAKKKLDVAKKEQISKSAQLLPSAIGADDLIQMQIKAINKSLTAMRYRLDTVDDDMKGTQQVLCKMERKKTRNNGGKETTMVNVLKIQPVPAPAGDIEIMRRKMAKLVECKLKNPPKLRRIVALPFASDTPGVTSSGADKSLISRDDILKKNTRIPLKSVANMSDAATQADFIVSTPTSTTCKDEMNSTAVEKNVGTPALSSLNTPSKIDNFSTTGIFGSSTKPLSSSTPLSKSIFGVSDKKVETAKVAENNLANLGGFSFSSNTQTSEIKAKSAPFAVSTNSVVGGDSNKSNFGPSSSSIPNKTSLFGTQTSSPISLPKGTETENDTQKDKSCSKNSDELKTNILDGSDKKKSDTDQVDELNETKNLFEAISDSGSSKDDSSTNKDNEKSVVENVDKTPAKTIFGATSSKADSSTTSIFGEASKEKSVEQPSIFGSTEQSATTKSSIFGGGAASAESTKTASIFGGPTTTEAPKTSSVFGGGTNTETTKTTSIFGGSTTASEQGKSSIFGSSTTSTDSTKTSSIFGGISTNTESAKPSSIFGGGNTTENPASLFSSNDKSNSIFGSNTGSTQMGNSSIFGGASSTATTTNSSPFGSFGKAENKPAQTAAPASFSFRNNTNSSAGGFSFNQPTSGSTTNSGFAAAAAKAAQEGMMEDDMTEAGSNNKGAAGFGSGFMNSLSFGTAKPATENKNVFGSALPSNEQKQSFLFKKDSGNTSFSNGQQQQQTGSFGSGQAQSGFFNSAAQQPSTPSSVFGGGPKFGGTPAFGSKPVFGNSSPFGGAASKPSVFGGAAPANTNSPSGFAAFANKSAGFGTGQPAGTSVFGGGSSNQSTQQSASIFGGGQNKNSFNTWR